MALDPGTKLGPFEIIAQIGKGGMGEVYRAQDTKLGRDVAIKVVSEAVASDAEYLKRFEREARTLASLDHPNIAAVYDFQHADGQHFLVMQLVDGETLLEAIRRGPLPPREAIPIFIQIARGLDAAHEAGIVHRDLKPANITLAKDGMVKILDFGIAKDITKADIDPNAPTTPMTSSPLTGEGSLIGTPHYMSPEQARGKPVDRRTDVWAFGCCLYQTLTGVRPYDGETMTDIVAGIIHEDPDWALLPTDLPRDLNRIVRRCLEKDLRRRPSSMNDLAIALEDVETDLRTGHMETVRITPSVSDTASIRSLVVLPFENLMGDEEQNYLVDGMTEALTAELSKIRALKVISRGSSMRYRKSDKPMPQIAQELGVDGLIEGSIFRAGDGIRITAQLIDGCSDAHLWSESFTGSMDSMLQLQGDVALAIAKAIQVAVTPEEKKQLRKHRHQISRDVQKVIWEANYAFNRQNPRGYRDAVRLYERAVEMDPECTPAYVGLAAAHWVPSILGIVRPIDALEKAEKASLKALEFDPDSQQAQYMAGYIQMMYHHDWEKSRKHFDRALELSPNSAEAHSGLGVWHMIMLEFEAGAREEEIARELDPMSPMHALNLGMGYVLLERYEDSDAHFADATELSPLFVLGRVMWHATRLWHDPSANSVKELEELLESFGDVPLVQGYLAWAYGRTGRTAKAAAIARSMEAAASERYIAPSMIGLAFQAAGDEKKAYAHYAKSIDEREWNALYLGADPWHIEGENRSDPRYRALLEKLRLPDSAIRRALSPATMWPRTVGRAPTAIPPAPPPKRPLPWAMSAVAGILLLIAGYFAGSTQRLPDAPEGNASYTLSPLTTLVGVEYQPTWSPDGNFIAYDSSTNGSLDIFVQSVAGDRPRLLVGGDADDASPRWSPDGRFIAFFSGRDASIYLIPALGGAVRKLAPTYADPAMGLPAHLGSNPWSPDSSHLLFSRDGDSGNTFIVKIDIATGEETQLTFPNEYEHDLSASWSHDGTKIVFSRVKNQIGALWVMSSDGKNPLKMFSGGISAKMPAWKRDDQSVIFAGGHSHRLDLWEMQVAPASEARPLAIGPDWYQFPSVSNSGRIAYSQTTHLTNLYSLSIDDETIAQLTKETDENFAARYSPDGNQIAYHSDKSGNMDIWIIDCDTLEQRQLTFSLDFDIYPDWSPDGSEIVFMSTQGGNLELWSVDAQGGVPERLTNMEIGIFQTGSLVVADGPRWSPDGSAIGFRAPGENGMSLWVLDTDDNTVQMRLQGVQSFDWYRDGKRLLYVPTPQNIEHASGIWAADLDTGEEALLYEGPHRELDVSSEGDRVCYIYSQSHFTMNLYMFELSSPDPDRGLPSRAGEPIRLTDGQGRWHVHNGGWAPDGKEIVYTRDTDDGNIYVLDPVSESME